MAYRIAPLEPATWSLFAELVERNGGVFGGCWCMGYYPEDPHGGDNERRTHDRVLAGTAHAALVPDDDGAAQGWAQFGAASELSRIKHRVEYEKDPPPRPDWRIVCVFVDRRHRGAGVARAAVGGALRLIGAAGGGAVEAIAEATAGRQAAGRFLFTGTAELFESFGFARLRQVGKHAWVLRTDVEAC